jgi:hypothetical protein
MHNSHYSLIAKEQVMGFKDICYKPLVEFYWHMHTVFTIQSKPDKSTLDKSTNRITARNFVKFKICILEYSRATKVYTGYVIGVQSCSGAVFTKLAYKI